MKLLKYLAFVMLSVFLASCGKPKDATKELNVSNAEVLGDSADIVSIVDGTYTLVGTVPTDMTEKLTLKLKLRLEKPVQDNGFKILGWHVNLTDGNGADLLDNLMALQLKDEEESKLKKFLTTGHKGDEEEFTFTASFGNDDLYKTVMDKAAGLRLTDVSLYVEPTYTATDTDSDVDESSSDASDTDEEVAEGDGDYDALLDSYEEFVDEYIALMKKAQNGDMDAVSQYASCMQKAQELGEKLNKAQGTMSAAQWARYGKILNKFTKALK